MPALLEADLATQVYDSRGQRRNVALSELSFSISGDHPSFTAVVGESGSGKTTMARALLGMQEPTSGEIRYNGKNVYKLKGADQLDFRREVQAIFQDPFEVYNPFYKVDHLLTVPIRKFRLARSRADAGNLIESALCDVGLEPKDTLGRYPHQLSGGQRQRLTVARGLLIRPRLIIADEPVSMVDASLRKTILGTLEQLNDEFGISFVYITHDLATAYQVSENIIVLYKGLVVEAGEVGRVIKRPEHPYTQLLVSSVPEPDPTRPWSGELPEGNKKVSTAVTNGTGCAFADRCPHVMPICVKERPPLYRTHDEQAAACFLYQETPRVVTGDVSQTFQPSQRKEQPSAKEE